MDATVSNVLQAAVFVKITKALYAALIVVPCQLRFESKKVHRIIMTLDRDFNVTASNATVLILRSLNSNILPIVMHSLNCLIMTDDVNLCECTMANNPRHTFSCTEKRAFIPASAPFPFLALSSKARTQIAAAAHTTTKQLGRGGKQTLPRKALTIHPGSLDSDLWDIDYPVRDCLDSLTASRARWRRQPTLFSIFTVRKGIDPSVPLALARPQYPD